MPKQNRPLVRDGRLQVNNTKKRTDRSYLEPAAPPPGDELPSDEAATLTEKDLVEVDESVAARALPVEPVVATATATSAVKSAPAPAKVPGAVRAMQQQGVRKRRDVDLDALAISDTRYAMHEVRRIAVLTTLIIATLIVVTILMR